MNFVNQSLCRHINFQFLGLGVSKNGVRLIDGFRNCYEAFAIYSFAKFLFACLGCERKTIFALMRYMEEFTAEN